VRRTLAASVSKLSAVVLASIRARMTTVVGVVSFGT
jgi:hypothetical protein